MERRHLEYFVAVADHEGFTSAAQTLHVAQPSLSQAIKSLERELGVELFHRLGHGIRLTAAGEALLGPARQALRDFDAARAAVLNVSDLESGRLDVVALPSLAADPLAALISRFHERHPGVYVRIADPRGRDIFDLVRSGDSELGVTMGPASSSELELVELPPMDLFVALPPTVPYESGAPLPVERLEDHPLIVATATKAMVTQILAEVGVSPRFAAETGHREAILPLVLGGVGGAILPPFTASAARAQGAVVCPFEPPLFAHTLIAHRRGPLTPAARAFLALVAEEPDRQRLSAAADLRL